MSDLIDLDPDTLTFAEVVDVARHDAKVRLSEATDRKSTRLNSSH